MAPPIGIYEGKIEKGDNTVIADEIKGATKLFNESLGAPDWDREIRVTSRSDDEPSTLRISCTVGDNEYPDNEDPSFRPTNSAISETAGKIINKIKQSGNADIDKLIIESWPDTTFCNYEQENVYGDTINEPESILKKKLSDYVSGKSDQHGSRAGINASVVFLCGNLHCLYRSSNNRHLMMTRALLRLWGFLPLV